ncbi:OsmC family protein [Bacillus sp. FSL K6-3431]|uniref:OsmC family protein n=1 Tax=Bacillus sp. FSL K6-3431 TaxID=2921500 RepID=UPI0030F6DEFE
MTIIKKINGSFDVYNAAGFQVEGSYNPDSKGLSPLELLESSLGLCISISLQKMFERDEIDVGDDEFSVKVDATKASDGPSRVEKCMVNITLPKHLSDEYKKKLIVSAERACTIGNTLKKGLIIHTNR